MPMRICGIDEAGRGPIIGPLVICAATIDKEKEAELKTLGVKDSKLLTPKKRQELALALPTYIEYKLIIVEPEEIDHYLNKDGTNLNWLEADKTVELINTLSPDYSIIDCPSPNIRAYTSYIQERVGTEIHTEHKADLNHPIAAAASILAKVARDRIIQELHKKTGVDFGSGYLTDEKTQAFIAQHWKTHPALFRKTWTTYKTLLAQQEQQKLNHY